MKDFLKAVLAFLALLAAVILNFSIAPSSTQAPTPYNEKEDERKYNGGICTECGGRYIYEQAVAHRMDTDYIYICDKCGNMIELDSYRPQERKEEWRCQMAKCYYSKLMA